MMKHIHKLSHLNIKRRAERPTDPLIDKHTVYDLRSSEWSERQKNIIQVDGSLLISKWAQEDEVFEIIVKQNKAVFSVFRSHDKKETDNIYWTIKKPLNLVCKHIEFSYSRRKMAEIIHDTVKAKLNNKLWSPSHIAAKLNLFTLFSPEYPEIIESINDEPEPDYITPLQVAIQENHIEAVKNIIALKPNLNLTNKEGDNILHLAITGTHDLFKEVLKNESEDNIIKLLEVENNKGLTPLYCGCLARKSINLKHIFFNYNLPFKLLNITLANINEGSELDSNEVEFREKDKDIEERQNERIALQNHVLDFNENEMSLGGNPLHWIKSRSGLLKLIRLGFSADLTNFDCQKPIGVAIKSQRLGVLIGFLFMGYNLNEKNENGDTLLHQSVKSGFIPAVQALIVFGAELNEENRLNQTARHLASISEHRSATKLLKVLKNVGAKRCAQDKLGCCPGCAFDDSLQLDDLDEYEGEIIHNGKVIETMVKEIACVGTESNDHKSTRILCISGAGIQGLISVQILIELNKRLKAPLSNYFNWISGSGSGSLIAAMMSTNYSLNTIRKMFFIEFKDYFLSSKKPLYNQTKLQRILTNYFGSDTLITDIRNKKLTIAIASDDLAEFYLLGNIEKPNSSHQKDNYDLKNLKLWKLCSASMAYPGYMKPFSSFVDGAVIAQNLAVDALSEFTRVTSHQLENERIELNLVVSIGSGKDAESDYRIRKRRLKKSDHRDIKTAESFCFWVKTPFFHFNPSLSKCLNFDESADDVVIDSIWQTQAYLHSCRKDINVLINYLEDLGTCNDTELITDVPGDAANVPFSMENIDETMIKTPGGTTIPANDRSFNFTFSPNADVIELNELIKSDELKYLENNPDKDDEIFILTAK